MCTRRHIEQTDIQAELHVLHYKALSRVDSGNKYREQQDLDVCSFERITFTGFLATLYGRTGSITGFSHSAFTLWGA